MLNVVKMKMTEMEIRQAVKSGKVIFDVLHNKDNENGVKTAVALGWLDNSINK